MQFYFTFDYFIELLYYFLFLLDRPSQKNLNHSLFNFLFLIFLPPPHFSKLVCFITDCLFVFNKLENF